MKNEQDSSLADEEECTSSKSRANEQHNTEGISKEAAIETSVLENSRSHGSHGSRDSGMTELSPPSQTKDSSIFTDHSNTSIIMQLPGWERPVVPPVSQMLTDGKSKSPKIGYTDDGTHDEVFWRIFDELENGDKIVRGGELKARLVSSNKFFVGDTVLITDRMVRTGKICNVGFDTYRRCGGK